MKTININGYTQQELNANYMLKAFQINSNEQLKEDMECRYDNVVISQMPKSKDIQSLFQDGILWALVRQSRNQLTPKSLPRVVERNILKRSYGREYEQSDIFFNKLFGKAKINTTWTR